MGTEDTDGIGLKRPIDIEHLLQWALQQSGRLPWCGVSDKDLAFDHGWTARPRAAGEYHGVSTTLYRAPSADANMVIDAIKALPGGDAAKVLACARSQIRPDWMEGIEPRQVQRKISWRKRKKRKGRHVSIVKTEWQPCTPQMLLAARHEYTRWHGSLTSLAISLSGRLAHWHVTGPRASERPWESVVQKGLALGQIQGMMTCDHDPIRVSRAPCAEPVA